MKKVIAAAAGLMMVGAMVSSVSAVENEFGGYWRTRMYTQVDYNDSDQESTLSVADTRTRLYYTAIFNENFQFVNKFEWNSTFGDSVGGDIGADGTGIFRIKNSYADFKVANAQFKIGTQGATLARGFLFADDFSGVVAAFTVSEDLVLPLAWMKVEEEDGVDGWPNGVLFDRGDEEDHYAVFPFITISDALTLNPYFVYSKVEGEDTNRYWAGMDVDMKTDAFSAWGTGIYNFGESADQDISAFLVAAGASTGPVHGQVFYASGDDDTADSDIDQFVNPQGRSYYWAEIMGAGIFDNRTPIGTPADGITNVWAANVGFKIAPMDKWTFGGDLWYAEQAEGEDIGFEIDFVATYSIMDNLNLDLVGAYLFAGDALDGDEDPIEVGARVSLAF